MTNPENRYDKIKIEKIIKETIRYSMPINREKQNIKYP